MHLASRQNTNHGSTKLAWYAAEAYQKGTIRYKWKARLRRESRTGTRVMTSPEVIFTICRRTTAYPYHILKSIISSFVNGGKGVVNVT